MSELFVLCTEMSDTKFVTTKHSNAAVRLWGRNRKTTFRQNGKEKNDVHRDNEHRIVSPTIPIHSLKACGLTQGDTPPESPLAKLKHKNGEDIFE